MLLCTLKKWTVQGLPEMWANHTILTRFVNQMRQIGLICVFFYPVCCLFPSIEQIGSITCSEIVPGSVRAYGYPIEHVMSQCLHFCVITGCDQFEKFDPLRVGEMCQGIVREIGPDIELLRSAFILNDETCFQDFIHDGEDF